MKKIVSGEYLRDKINEGINLLCNTVKETLGPKGNNVIIDHSNFMPFITNDGVTIAQNIESDDPVLGSIIEIAKEASIKTNDNVGDGTTTTLVLMQALVNLGQKYLDDGINSLVLKKKLNSKLNDILKILETMKITTTKEMLKNIATVSASDESIGTLVSEVVENIDNKSGIIIKEDFSNAIRVKYIKGYTCSISHPSEYYFQSSKSFTFNDAYILIINDILSEVENISSILNEVIINNKSLVIIAKDFDQDFVNEIVSLNFEKRINCFMIRICECGLKERIIQKDIEVITNCTIVENSNHITGDNVGLIKGFYIDKETIRIDFTSNKEIDNYVLKIDEELNDKDEFELDFFQKRKAMFTKGIAEIVIGAPTKTESHEKRMRLEDALFSAYASKNGILLGGGISLLRIANELKDSDYESLIWKETLMQPFRQIMQNAGLSVEEIECNIKKSNYSKIYNVYSDCYENINDTHVVDAYEVVANSLINACSIAVMLLTTNSLVINEYQNNINKSVEYTEI